VCRVVDGSDRPEEGDSPDVPDADPAAGYVPPDQRWWRHPSELSGARPARSPALIPAPGGSRAALVLVAVIGAAGAVLAAYIAHLARPATDETATRSTAIRLGVTTSSSITLATVAAPVTSAVPGVVKLLVSSGGSTRAETAAVVGEGHLVTSAKVVAGVTQVTAVMADGSEQQAKVVWLDHQSGTAVLDIEKPTPTLAGGQAATLDKGDAVTAAGTDNRGQVEAVGVEATSDDGSHMAHLLKVRMDQPVDDGAVLLDGNGRAVGICVGYVRGDQTAALAAPIELARAATGAADQNGERRLAWLGITGRSATAKDMHEPATTEETTVATAPPSSSVPEDTGTPSATTADTESTTTTSSSTTTTTAAAETTTSAAESAGSGYVGALVLKVEKGTAADAAGLREGDVVLALDGVPVRSMNALILLVRERKVGGEIHLTVEREGTTIELDAVLKDRKDRGKTDDDAASSAPIRT
jgi:S1-C subfamily serine protease